MPLSARDVVNFIALKNKLKYKEETTDFKNSTLLWVMCSLHCVKEYH